jgi:hypothetical protein
VSCGRVQFEWQYGGRDLEWEFNTPETLIYLKCPCDDHETWVDGEVSVHDDAEITALLKWLFEGTHATE